MTKPSKFRYGPYDFDILYRSDLVERCESMGETHFNHLEIYLDSRMKPQMEKETMLHELLHVLLHDIGFFKDSDDEETFIRLLSPRMAQLFIDNPELTSYIFFDKGLINGKTESERKPQPKPRKPRKRGK